VLAGWGEAFDKFNLLSMTTTKAEIDKTKHNVTSSLELFTSAREKGIRLHYWI
jgi:hypothetical protein